MKHLRSFTAIFSLIGLASLLLAEPEAPRPRAWELAATTNTCTPRHECGLTALHGKLYLLGGRGLKPVEEYDPTTKTWRQLAKPPLEMHHFQAVAIGDRLAVIGAMTGAFPRESPVADVWFFHPQKNEWSKGGTIPEGRRRGGGGVIVAGEKVYLLCGITEGHWRGFVPWVDLWDMEKNTWTTLPDAPHARDHFQAGMVAGKIVCAGGRTTHGEIQKVFELTVPEVDVFDIATSTWQTLASPLPTPRAGTATVAVGDDVIIIGGESGTQAEAHSQVEALTLTKGNWTTHAPLCTGRHGTGAAALASTLYIASGCARRGGSPEQATIESIPWPLPPPNKTP